MCPATSESPHNQSLVTTESIYPKSNSSIKVRCPRCGSWAERHFDFIEIEPIAKTECHACEYRLTINIFTGKVIDSDLPVYRHNN